MGRVAPSLHGIPRLVQAAPPSSALRRDRGSFCQPTTTLAQKVARPFNPLRRAATAENYPRNLQSPFFQAPADSASASQPIPSRAQENESESRSVIRPAIVVGAARRGFFNNRATASRKSRGVLSRFSRATSSCLTFYGRRETESHIDR